MLPCVEMHWALPLLSLITLSICYPRFCSQTFMYIPKVSRVACSAAVLESLLTESVGATEYFYPLARVCLRREQVEALWATTRSHSNKRQPSGHAICGCTPSECVFLQRRSVYELRGALKEENWAVLFHRPSEKVIPSRGTDKLKVQGDGKSY